MATSKSTKERDIFKLFKHVTREENGKVMLVHRVSAHMRIRMSLILGLGVMVDATIGGI